MTKTLLVLGGAAKSLPLMRCARRRGHHLILCDGDPDAPCRALTDRFVHGSAGDVDRVLAAVHAYGVSGIVSFGSDRLAEVAAEVAERCCLPGNPLASVVTMGRKDLFRTFLADHGFSAPGAVSGDRLDRLAVALRGLALPVIVKPVDASGSVGVTRLDDWGGMAVAFEQAAIASRTGRVIIEEFIERDHDHVIAGDAFVDRGQVVFWGLLDSHRGAANAPFLPTGTSFPIALSETRQKRVRDTVQALVDVLGIRFGPLNLELIYGQDGRLHVIEMAPRNGGNCIPDLLYDATGADLAGALVDAALGDPVRIVAPCAPRYLATYMVHAAQPGRFEALELDEMVRPHLYRLQSYVRPGDPVSSFRRAADALGVLFLEFASLAEQQAIMERIADYVRVELDADRPSTI